MAIICEANIIWRRYDAGAGSICTVRLPAAEGKNEHHKIEGIFKALARAMKMAVKRDIYHFELPSSKGML